MLEHGIPTVLAEWERAYLREVDLCHFVSTRNRVRLTRLRIILGHCARADVMHLRDAFQAENFGRVTCTASSGLAHEPWEREWKGGGHFRDMELRGGTRLPPRTYQSSFGAFSSWRDQLANTGKLF